MCALPCASARTITHCFATMLTHGDVDLGLGGRTVDGAGLGITAGIEAVVDGPDGCGIVASRAGAGVDAPETSENTTSPARSVVSRDLAVSRGVAASTGLADVS